MSGRRESVKNVLEREKTEGIDGIFKESERPRTRQCGIDGIFKEREMPTTGEFEGGHSELTTSRAFHCVGYFQFPHSGVYGINPLCAYTEMAVNF